MSTSYIIQWKSLVNGRAGRGTKVFEQAEAEQLAAELNREYPEIHHEVIPADIEPQAASPPEPVSEEKQPAPETEAPAPDNPQTVTVE